MCQESFSSLPLPLQNVAHLFAAISTQQIGSGRSHPTAVNTKMVGAENFLLSVSTAKYKDVLESLTT